CRGILERSSEVVLAVEVRADRRRIERRVVLELHPVPEVEGPVLPVPRAPLGGQPRANEGRTRLQRDQALEDLLGHAEDSPSDTSAGSRYVGSDAPAITNVGPAFDAPPAAPTATSAATATSTKASLE